MHRWSKNCTGAAQIKVAFAFGGSGFGVFASHMVYHKPFMALGRYGCRARGLGV